jgi:amino acid transporter
MADRPPAAQLQKTITLWRGLALAVSTVIGSGLLGLPGMALEIGTVHTVVGGWLFISLMLIPLVYIFSCLGLRFTSSAGLSKYVQVSIGDWGGHAVTAVLCGTFVVGIPVLALIGGAYAQNMCGLPEKAGFGLAIGILILATGFNLFGVAATNWINTASLLALVAMTVVLVLSNIPLFILGMTTFAETLGGKGHLDYAGLWRTAALLFWAFIGWENLSFSMEEFKNPAKTIPAVYWISFILVIGLYMALTITSIGAEVSGISVKGAAGLASLVSRTPIGMVLKLIMVVVISANACAWVMGASRLYYASGRDGILPAIFGKLTNGGIPRNSLLLSLLIYSAVILAAEQWKLPPANLVLLVSQNFLVLYLLSIFAYWKTEKTSRRWFVSVLGLLSCAFLLSGFSWWIAYPVCLVGVGFCNYFRGKLRTVTT